MMIKSILSQHIIGLTGQVSAALPMLLITIVLARWVSVEQAGYFSIYIGSSAVVFSLGLWGLRPQIVLDRYVAFGKSSYSFFRYGAILFSCLVAFMSADDSKLDVILIWIVIFYRSIDSVVDLNMAFDQVSLPNSKAIRNFSLQHVVKLSLVLISLLVGYLFGFVIMYISLFICGVIMLLFNVSRQMFSQAPFTSIKVSKSFDTAAGIFKAGFWFALASLSCAVITNLPRISVASFYEEEALGVVGVTLSVTAFFGMVYNMTWVRALPKFSLIQNRNRVITLFIVENSLVTLILLIGAYFLLPNIVAFIFDFNGRQNLEISRNVMLCSVIFFCGQIFSNLYKVTSKPWLEVCSYSLALLVALCWWLVGADSLVSMIMFSLIGFYLMERRYESGVIL